jgi:hypothetical protein
MRPRPSRLVRVSRIVLHIDAEQEPDRARRAFDSHLARAKWMIAMTRAPNSDSDVAPEMSAPRRKRAKRYEIVR